jgi:hypothetical protein
MHQISALSVDFYQEEDVKQTFSSDPCIIMTFMLYV